MLQPLDWKSMQHFFIDCSEKMMKISSLSINMACLFHAVPRHRVAIIGSRRMEENHVPHLTHYENIY